MASGCHCIQQDSAVLSWLQHAKMKDLCATAVSTSLVDHVLLFWHMIINDFPKNITPKLFTHMKEYSSYVCIQNYKVRRSRLTPCILILQATVIDHWSWWWWLTSFDCYIRTRKCNQSTPTCAYRILKGLQHQTIYEVYYCCASDWKLTEKAAAAM